MTVRLLRDAAPIQILFEHNCAAVGNADPPCLLPLAGNNQDRFGFIGEDISNCKELWDAVQAKLKEREAWIRKAGPTSGKRAHPLYGKIICGRCGGLMSRNTHTGYNGEKHKVWICKDRLKGRRGNGCRGRIVREDEVLEVMNTGSTADNLQNTVIKILDDGIEVCAEM